MHKVMPLILVHPKHFLNLGIDEMMVGFGRFRNLCFKRRSSANASRLATASKQVDGQGFNETRSLNDLFSTPSIIYKSGAMSTSPLNALTQNHHNPTISVMPPTLANPS